MKIETINLDHGKNGFLIVPNEPNPEEEYKQKLYSNLQLPSAILSTKKNKDQFHIELFLKDTYIPLEYIEYVSDHWEFFGRKKGDVCRFQVYEDKEHVVSNLGYIVFDNGDVERSYFVDRAIELYDEMWNHIHIMWRNKENHIDNIHYDNKNMEIDISFFNTTTELHIRTIQHMIAYNQERIKRKGEKVSSVYYRVLPFIKEMDRNSCFYTYVTRIEHEPCKNGSYVDTVANTFILNLIDSIKSTWSGNPVTEPHFVEVEFGGKIYI